MFLVHFRRFLKALQIDKTQLINLLCSFILIISLIFLWFKFVDLEIIFVTKYYIQDIFILFVYDEFEMKKDT